MLRRISTIVTPALILAGALLPGKATAKLQLVDRLEASVNGQLILRSDVEDFRGNVGLRAQLDPLFSGTSLSEKGAGAPRSEIVQFLIDERIILNEFPVTDSEVEQQINSIQANNNIGRKELRSMISQQGYDFDDYFELIRTSIAKRNLMDRDIRTKVHISKDDIKNYFYNQISEGSKLTYRIKIITVTPSNYRSPEAAEETAQRALKAVRSGEEFEEVAKRFSDSPSAPSGGDLGLLEEDEMAPRIRKAVKKMKVGQTSDLIGNAGSMYFILKLADIQSDQEGRLARMEEEIRNQLTAIEYQHQIALWLDRQRQDAYIHLAGQPSIPPRYAQ